MKELKITLTIAKQVPAGCSSAEAVESAQRNFMADLMESHYFLTGNYTIAAFKVSCLDTPDAVPPVVVQQDRINAAIFSGRKVSEV